MAERGAWRGRASFGALALLLLAVPLLPLGTAPRVVAPPDLLLLVALAWVVRRPDALPVPLLGGAFLLADLLLQRPPGLMAALVVLAAEWLRPRARALSKGPFLVEWMAVGAAAAAVLLGARLLQWLLVVPQAAVGLVLIQVLLTAAAFPLVALLAGAALGPRAAPELEG